MENLPLQTGSPFEICQRIEGARVGTIAMVDGEGRVFVSFPDTPGSMLPARLTISSNARELRKPSSVGREVLVVFENNDASLPIIVDALHSLLDDLVYGSAATGAGADAEDATFAGKRISFDAEEEIEFSCGKASITLSRSGRIVIRGTSLLSRATGVNRIKGGSVQIN